MLGYKSEAINGPSDFCSFIGTEKRKGGKREVNFRGGLIRGNERFGRRGEGARLLPPRERDLRPKEECEVGGGKELLEIKGERPESFVRIGKSVMRMVRDGNRQLREEETTYVTD